MSDRKSPVHVYQEISETPPQIINKKTKVAMVEALQEFWQMKAGEKNSNLRQGALLIYEAVSSTKPPYICFVTLPGGACFGSIKECSTRAEARRNAAKIALMNSVYNEQPSRKINEMMIKRLIGEAENTESKCKSKSKAGIDAYKYMLEINLGKTILEYKEVMNVFHLLHWNGSLKAMRERECSKQEVVQHYTHRRIDDDMRAAMAIDWIAREKDKPGTIDQELIRAEDELESLRKRGEELRFPKEKKDVLNLAISQISDRNQK